jgi:hypothetical protein
VALRPYEGRLLMHQLYHADEVRPVEDVKAPEAEARPAELKLARELVARLTTERFAPERYADEVRKRIRALIDRKVEGGEIRTAPEGKAPAKVIDLMEALKASLAAGRVPKDKEKEKQARTARPSARDRCGRRDSDEQAAARRRGRMGRPEDGLRLLRHRPDVPRPLVGSSATSTSSASGGAGGAQPPGKPVQPADAVVPFRLWFIPPEAPAMLAGPRRISNDAPAARLRRPARRRTRFRPAARPGLVRDHLGRDPGEADRHERHGALGAARRPRRRSTSSRST